MGSPIMSLLPLHYMLNGNGACIDVIILLLSSTQYVSSIRLHVGLVDPDICFDYVEGLLVRLLMMNQRFTIHSASGRGVPRLTLKAMQACISALHSIPLEAMWFGLEQRVAIVFLP